MSRFILRTKSFGYIALAYEDNRIDYQFRLVQWQININQMLQSVCEAKRTGMLVDRLEDIYMKDALTGLYNRHGYDRLERAALKPRPLGKPPSHGLSDRHRRAEKHQRHLRPQ